MSVRVIGSGILAGLVLFGLGAAGAHAAEARPLNLVMVLMTCGRADHMSFNGYKRETTPNLNRLAETGTVFLNAFSQAPTTVASTASFMLSQYAWDIYGGDNRWFRRVSRADPKREVLTRILKEHGYATGAFTGYMRTELMKRLLLDSPILDFEMILSRSDFLLRKVPKEPQISEWLKAHREGPFFLLLQGFDMHEPHALDDRKEAMRFNPDYKGKVPSTNREVDQVTLQAEKNASTPLTGPEAWAIRHAAYLDMFVTPDGVAPEDVEHLRALYDAQVYQADAGVGRALEILDELGLMEETLIVVFSEHGQLLGEHGLYALHWGGYDEVLHVPLLIYDPRQKRTRRVKTLVSLLDVVPTILDLLGLPISEKFAGESLLPLMRDGRDPGREEVTVAHWAGGRSIRTPKWKLTENRKGPTLLFNLARDPEETRSVLAEHPKVVRRLQAELGARAPLMDRETPPIDPRVWMRQESYW